MKQVVINVTDCRDCPFRKQHRGHGECWDYCSNQNTGLGLYDRILFGCNQPSNFRPPNWCPVFKESNDGGD